MAEDPLAEQNRRKLAAHLEQLAQSRGKPSAEGTADRTASGATPRPPKPPPTPPGWEAWKRAHGSRLHTVQYVDASAAAEAADYALLELKPGASQADVRRNFHRLAKEYHPDHGGDAEIFAAMQAAYKRISGGK